METFSALLAIFAVNSPVPGEFPTHIWKLAVQEVGSRILVFQVHNMECTNGPLQDGKFFSTNQI